MTNKPTVVITHTAVSSKSHTHLDVGQWHKDRWKKYSPSAIRTDVARFAGYHYIINWDGTTEQCRYDFEEGIHCKGMNFSSIGVCFMGNGDVHEPSLAQMLAWHSLYRELQTKYFAIPTRPHSAYSTKSCHGNKLSKTYFTTHEYKLTLVAQLKRLVSLLQSIITGRRMK